MLVKGLYQIIANNNKGSCMTSCRSAAVVLMLFLTLSPLASARDWYEYKSDNFTVYSDVSEREVNELLRDMEKFRSAALIFTRLNDKPENQNLQIFHFHSRGEFDKFTGSRSVAGFYKDTWDGPLIFSQRGRGNYSGTEVMFHEYVHHLMRERSNMVYPKWYSEGFAELLATTEIRKDSVVIGGVPEGRLRFLDGSDFGARPLTLAELLAPDTENDSVMYASRYYATAWLFTHYLQLGALSGNSSYGKQTRDYLVAIKNGADPIASFATHFGKSVDEMQGELKRYLRDHLVGFRFDIAPYEKEILRRKLPDSERAFLMADKALDVGNEELALEYLLGSDKPETAWEANLSLAAVLRNHNEESEVAASLAAQVENGEIGDYRTATNLAHYYVDRLQPRVAKGSWDEMLYSQAVHYARSAIALNPAHLPAYRYLWMAQQHKGNNVAAVKTMMAAFQQDPGNLFLNQTIGFYLAEINRPDLAKPFLEKVIAWAHAGETRTAAKKILDSLEQKAEPAIAEDEMSGSKSG